MNNTTEFKRTIQSLSTKELVEMVSNGDTPNKEALEASVELDKRKVNIINVKSHI